MLHSKHTHRSSIRDHQTKRHHLINCSCTFKIDGQTTTRVYYTYIIVLTSMFFFAAATSPKYYIHLLSPIRTTLNSSTTYFKMTLQTLPTKVPCVACYDPQRCYEFVNFEANKMLVEIQGAPLTQNK